MTSHLNSHETTDIKTEMLSGVKTGNSTPHDKYDIRGIANVRKTRFYAKTTSAKLYMLHVYWSGDLYINEEHTALDIFRFAAVQSSTMLGENLKANN